LIQVASIDGDIYLIDARALQGALDPLGQLFNDAGVLKLMHAAGQDVGILQSWMGVYATPLFDVQVAAAFVGHPMQVGYGKLVAAELKARLPKDEGVSDWTRRPFAPAMLEYAASDVEHLHALHDRLTRKLTRLGRETWAREAMDQLLESHTRVWDQDDLWRRVNGRQSLGRRELAILRELAIWRDEEARERNRPRRSIMKDEVLIELVRRAPDSVRAMNNLRSIPPNLGERRMQELVDAVRAAKALHPDQLPEAETFVQLDDQGAALYELLSAVVRIRAIETDLPAQLLAPSDALRQAASDRALSPDNPLRAGWRGELLGEDLSRALAGKSALAWDAAEERLVIRAI
jgi:ribonuclease D